MKIEIRELGEIEVDQVVGGTLVQAAVNGVRGAAHKGCGDDDDGLGGGSLAVLLLAVGGAVAGVLY
jgi:hypothetical protein